MFVPRGASGFLTFAPMPPRYSKGANVLLSNHVQRSLKDQVPRSMTDSVYLLRGRITEICTLHSAYETRPRARYKVEIQATIECMEEADLSSPERVIVEVDERDIISDSDLGS
ncbi:hypothetical protein FRB95_003862 [Tulasnella sp. JGI-2019a]|nr:hypothetical protein FRB93_003728 [Tulasnella sp. JGI-2019a]KAG9030533.1 hypothetical protein FRB95_003862 [Tulasnella sp. JGI-2019a]